MKGWAESRPAADDVKLIADSKDFSSDKRALGFVLLLCFSVPLMFAPMFLLVAPAALGIPPQVALSALAGGLFMMLFIGLFLKGRGVIFKVPLRVFDEGILIQPPIGLRPSLVPYSDISAIELFYGAGGRIRAGCSLSTISRGRVRSVEHFSSRESLKSFVERIAPELAGKGFRLQDVSEAGSLARFTFRRQIIPPDLVPAAGWRI